MNDIIKKLSKKEQAVIRLMEKEMTFEQILKELKNQFTTSGQELSEIIDKLTTLGLLKETQNKED